MVLKKILPALLAVLVFAQGCYQGSIEVDDFKYMIKPTKVPNSGGPLGGVLSALPLDIPFEDFLSQRMASQKEVTEIYLVQIGLRSAVAADYDEDGAPIKARLANESLIGPCASGQPKLDFIKKIDIYIQKEGSVEKFRIAHYAQSRTGECGIFLEPDVDERTGKLYNLKEFLPRYTVTNSVSANYPPTEVKLGGYVMVDLLAPEVSVPPAEPSN